jgi:hypothetical protein
MKRRTFLRIGSAAMAGGIEGIVRARRAPAFAQPVKVHLPHWKPEEAVKWAEGELKKVYEA